LLKKIEEFTSPPIKAERKHSKRKREEEEDIKQDKRAKAEKARKLLVDCLGDVGVEPPPLTISGDLDAFIQETISIAELYELSDLFTG
jgi:hypothetical protein